MLSGGILYGTTELGGSSGYGTVFAVNTDGTGFATLHHFIGSDGAAPDVATLLLSGNTLYGRQILAAARVVEPSSPSRPMARALPFFIVFSGGNDGLLRLPD